jgi:hypothetical protein
MIESLTLTLTPFASPVLRGIWDWWTIEIKKQSINYAVHNSVTALIILLQTCLLAYITPTPPWEALFISVALHAMLFDYFLNGLRGKPVFSYYGNFKDTVNLSFIEEHIYQKVHWELLLQLKVIFFLQALIIYCDGR